MDKNKGFRNNLVKAFLLIISLMFFSFSLFAPVSTNFKFVLASNEKLLQVHFIDVGQGDSTFVKLPDGKTMLIDAGPTSSKNKVVSYLKNLKVSSIDYLILTHSDEDHSGGMAAVLENFEVKQIFRPFVIATNNSIEGFVDELSGKYTESEIFSVTTFAYANFVHSAYQETYIEDGLMQYARITVNYDGYVIISSSSLPYTIEFHHPPKASETSIPSNITEGYPTKYYDNDTNALSAIISLVFGDEKFLFTGDATAKSEKDFINNLPSAGELGYARADAVKNVSLLKVAHHGSNTSSTESFLSLVNPKYVVIMCSANNNFGHPNEKVLERLNALWFDNQNHIFRTDLNGNIVAETNGTGLEFSVEKNTYEDAPPEKDFPNWIIYVIVSLIVIVIIASVIVRIYKIKNESKDNADNNATKITKKQKNEIKKHVKDIVNSTKIKRNKTGKGRKSIK